MKVMCQRTKLTARLSLKRRIFGLSQNYDCGLAIGQVYTAFGVWVSKGECDIGIGASGHTFPIELFDVVDPRCSRYWRMSRPDINKHPYTVFSYDDIVRDYAFYEALIDRNEHASAVHAKWLERLEREFHRDDLTRASPLGGAWLQCLHCSDAWQATTEDGVVACPRCDSVFNNPLAAASTHAFERRII